MRYALVLLALLLTGSVYAQVGGQVNEAAFAKRAEANKAACDAALPVVSVDHPGNITAALEAARATCMEAREVMQGDVTMKQCQIRASRKASPQITVKMAYKACMQGLGHDVGY